MKRDPRIAVPLAASAALVVLVAVVFWHAGDYSFVGFDDPSYITDNPPVRAGLTAKGATWAFTTFHASNWHPLTWLSHMADVSLFGLEAGWHHRVSVLFHGMNAILLFLVLRGMTGEDGKSWFVAALFAVHPLHVESVAWVAERKDLLSGLFFFLALWGYARYAERPGTGRYLPVALLFALGLLSKPMVVTLPFVLLLLDWWPLGRFRGGSIRGLALEKVPLLVLSAASCGITYAAQHQGGAITPQEILPLGVRLSNALVSCAAYLWKTIWPVSLAVFYPHPSSIGERIPAGYVAGASLLLAGISWVALRQRRRLPGIVAGWLWFLGTMVPVIGLVPVGAQAMADRYTYLPLIGIFVAVSWGIPASLGRSRFRKQAAGIAVAGILAALATAARVQAGYWRDSVSLFTRAMEVTEKNWLAAFNLGLAYDEIGQTRQSVRFFREALGIRPHDSRAWSRLGEAQGKLGEYREAVASFKEALRYSQDDAAAWSGLGAAHLHLGEPREAIPNFRESVRLRPDFAEAWSDLGVAYLETGERRQAIESFREALRFRPEQAVTWNNLGSAYLQAGQPGQAVPCFLEALRIRPGYPSALYNLGLAYKETGRRKEAAEAYRMLREVDPEKAAAFLSRHGVAR